MKIQIFVRKKFILEMADLGFFGGGSDSSDSEEETVQGEFRFYLGRDSSWMLYGAHFQVQRRTIESATDSTLM